MMMMVMIMMMVVRMELEVVGDVLVENLVVIHPFFVEYRTEREAIPHRLRGMKERNERKERGK